MAASAPLADIEEKFFHCSFCLEPFKDPKLLPCLHRYCRGCLATLIAEKQDSFNCPLCREVCKIPEGRAEGFLTDFHIKSVVDFLQLQATFEEDNVRKCHGCKQTKQATAYCFKCNNFLCDQCHQLHLTNEIGAEHRPHLLNLQSVDLRSLTLEKLASLTEHPRCTSHAKHLTDLSCATCNNLPICVVCTYGKHRGHDIHDIQVLAQTEREKLNAVLSELNEYKDRLYELPKKVANVRQRLEENVKAKVEQARAEHKRACGEVSGKIEDNKIELEKRKKEIQDRKENDCNQVKQECKEEIEKVKQRYDAILKQKEQHYDTEIKQVECRYGRWAVQLSAKLEQFRKELAKFESEITAKQVQNEERCREISDHSEHTINRYEIFTETTSTILAANNEWTDAQCLPSVTAASGPLLDNVKKHFPEMDSFSELEMDDLLLRFIDVVTITGQEESAVDIHSISRREWQVYGITNNTDGNIIITGWAPDDEHSHITVVNRKGELVRQEFLKKASGGRYYSLRYCASLSQTLIATVCASNQVGIYDVGNGKYVKKDLGDLSIGLSGRVHVNCVATDTLDNIYVGGNCRGVLVFDRSLNYQYSLKLPYRIEYPYDMIVHDGQLLVCDHHNQRVFAVTMDGREAEVLFEFPKPTCDRDKWRPKSVCADTAGFTYILWSGWNRCVMAQYSQNGQQLVTTRKVDKDAQCMTAHEENGEEKLLICTRLAKLYTYGLIKSYA